MRKTSAWLVCGICTLALASGAVAAEAQVVEPLIDQHFALYRVPPMVNLIGLPQAPKGRAIYLALITREAEKAGLPPAVADAVAHVESRFNPMAVGSVGEVGLMQIRPQTAAMLGYRNGLTGLFDPETNVHYGVKYLARAWQLANGDLCRALMKYRAGHGEERMTPLSLAYCRRARHHLAGIGSALGDGSSALATATFNGEGQNLVDVEHARRRDVDDTFSGSVTATRAKIAVPRRTELRPGDAFQREVKLAQLQVRSRHARTPADSVRFWAAHEARIREMKGKRRGGLKLRIASGA